MSPKNNGKVTRTMEKQTSLTQSIVLLSKQLWRVTLECLGCQQRTTEGIKRSIEECLECQQSLEYRQKVAQQNSG